MHHKSPRSGFPIQSSIDVGALFRAVLGFPRRTGMGSDRGWAALHARHWATLDDLTGSTSYLHWGCVDVMRDRVVCGRHREPRCAEGGRIDGRYIGVSGYIGGASSRRHDTRCVVRRLRRCETARAGQSRVQAEVLACRDWALEANWASTTFLA